MALLLNRAKMTTATTGTGTITLGSAVSPYQTFANASAVNGQVYSYVIEDGTAWEIGTGTYTSSGTTLSRTLVASSTGSLISLSGSATVAIEASVNEYPISLISSQTPSGTGTVTFSSIPQTFTDLQLRVRGRTTQVATATIVSLQFNGDTGSNYDSEDMQANNASVAAFNQNAGTQANIGNLCGSSAPSNVADFIITDISAYANTTFQKAALSRGTIRTSTAAGGAYTERFSLWWRSTAAITSIDVKLAGGNFVSGSVVSLYGHL